MSFATTTVEVAFASAPLGGSYTWVDITDYVKGFDTQRGRSYELDQIQAGTASITLSNADGRFTPGSASSPYYPNVLPRKRIRIRSTDPNGSGGSSVTQPVIDATATATASSATSITWNHTVGTGSNRLLVVDIGFTANSDEVGTLTFGGVAMTKAGSDQSGTGGTDRRFERWYLVAPASGTGSIVATLYNSATHSPSGVTVTTIAAASTSLVNVDQTTPVGTSVIAHGSANTTGSLAPTTLTNDLVMSGVMARTTTAETGSGTATSASLLSGTNNYLAYGTGNGATSWAWTTADNFGAVATPVHGVTVVTSAATTVFTGLVESWQQSFVGGSPDDSEVVLNAVDGFKTLGQAGLPAWYDSPVLRGSGAVRAFYPLSDASGSLSAVESMAGLTAAPVGVNPSAITFGAATITADGQTSVQFTPSHTREAESPVQVYLRGQGYAMPTASGAIDFFFNSSGPHGSLNPIFFATQSVDGTAGLTIGLTAVLGYLTLQDGASTTYTGTANLSDGGTHHVAYVWTSATNRTLYLDGAVVFTTTTAPSAFGAYDSINIGSASVPWHSGTLAGSTAPPPFRMAKFGFYSTLSASDVLDRYTSGITGHRGEDESSRISRLLNYVQWPAADVALDGGLSSLDTEAWSAGSNALAEIQACATDAGGYVFVNGAGQVVYHNRQHRLNQTAKATFQESSGTGIEGDIQFHMDDSNIKNDVTVTAGSNTPQRVLDTASQANYGTCSEALTLAITSQNEALDAANWRVALYKDAHVRCDTLTIQPVTSNALWSPALGLEIGDRITVAGLPASAPATSVNFIVEAVKHTVTASGMTPDWSTSIQLSPDLPIQALTLDDNTFGILDTDCLVY